MSREVQPAVARVRPRVVVAGAPGEPVLLEEWVADRLATRGFGVASLVGSPGAGKTTALRHLAARFEGRTELALYDAELPPDGVAENRLVLVAHVADARVVLAMAPWTRDDLIEYVLATHPEAAASILERAESGSDGRFGLCGRPGPWVAVVETLASDVDLPDVPAAIERLIDAELSTAQALALGVDLLAGGAIPDRDSAPALVEFDEVRQALMWRVVLDALEDHGWTSSPSLPAWLVVPPRWILPDARRCLPAGGAARGTLERIVTKREQDYAGAAVILNAADRRALRPLLAGRRGPAHLAGAYLPCVDLADLAEWLHAPGADLRGARLSGARLANLSNARLSDAIMSRVQAPGANFNSACMKRADLSEGRFEGASFHQADLRGARLDGAGLVGAFLLRATLTGCSLHWADLSHAALTCADLRGCGGETVVFHQADLEGATLEGLIFEAPDFSGAILDRALLTDSRFPRGDFREASLVETGLAGISWARADLRDADLSRASFHLGSSRSGLLFAGPSEGTRTGFYTEEMHDLAHKDAAEVRVADLRGADLTGAHTQDTDWYRVDLRGALIDAVQRRHMAGCGAILGRE